MEKLSTLENQCFLQTNGLGGYCTQTMAYSCTRQDAAILMRAKKAPNERINLVHRLEEQVIIDQQEYYLSSQQPKENGFEYLVDYSMKDIPNWKYQVEDITVERKMAMYPLENTTGIQYAIQNNSDHPIVFRVRPHFSFFEKGNLCQEPEVYKKVIFQKNQVRFHKEKVYFSTTGTVKKEEIMSHYSFYPHDARDGRNEEGYTCTCMCIEYCVAPHTKKVLDFLLSDKKISHTTSQEILDAYQNSKDAFLEACSFKGQEKLADQLVKSAMDFISQRDSTKSKTIIAGYPFFADWGRDTMIALPGILLSTNHLDMAKDVLKTFLQYEKKGLIPNLFPENSQEPMYNTVDAALLLFECMYLYYQKSHDIAFIQDSYSILEDILSWYKKGTDFAIYMDRDCLIHAGQGLDQVTWMDVRINDILPTPRHGKCVEINAYWYNALCIMDLFQNILGKNNREYKTLANKVKHSFVTQFWNEELGCCKDVLTDDFSIEIENQIRCNQVWALSLSFTMFDPEKELRILQTIEKHLYTPFGLRTLSPEDPDFHPKYEGNQFNRDMAYHQGTIWPYPLGAYYRAYLRIHQYGPEAISYVKEQLNILEHIFQEGCINQICEVYDGEKPTRSKGCFAQAWSVSEILRVYEVILERGRVC